MQASQQPVWEGLSPYRADPVMEWTGSIVGDGARSMTANCQSDLLQQRICRYRMGQKTPIARNLVRSKMAHLIRGQNQTQPRPAVMDVLAQFNTVHQTGDVNIGQENVYIFTCFQGCPSLIRVLGLDDFKLSPGQDGD